MAERGYNDAEIEEKVRGRDICERRASVVMLCLEMKLGFDRLSNGLKVNTCFPLYLW